MDIYIIIAIIIIIIFIILIIIFSTNSDPSSKLLVFEDGKLTVDMKEDIPWVWNGLFSQMKRDSHIINYIKEILPKDSICIIPHSDGNIKRINKKDEYSDISWSEIEPYFEKSKKDNKTFLLCTLSQITEEPDINYIYLPLDDEIFDKGIEHFFPFKNKLQWKDRSSELCWRGAASGIGGAESLRIRFVKKIYEYNKYSDVRLSGYHENKNIPREYIGERIDYKEFLKYKIFFIVDGAVIASNHMWGFASGCIPFIISNGKCWFSELIIPYVHYIPINYNLDNLIEKIEWVKNNDEKARIIAENAYNFARKYFSAEYQKEYLKYIIHFKKYFLK